MANKELIGYKMFMPYYINGRSNIGFMFQKHNHEDEVQYHRSGFNFFTDLKDSRKIDSEYYTLLAKVKGSGNIVKSEPEDTDCTLWVCSDMEIIEEVSAEELLDIFLHSKHKVAQRVALRFLTYKEEINNENFKKRIIDNEGKMVDLNFQPRIDKRAEIKNAGISYSREYIDKDLYEEVNKNELKNLSIELLAYLKRKVQLSMQENKYFHSYKITSIFNIDEQIYKNKLHMSKNADETDIINNRYRKQLYDYMKNPKFKIKSLAYGHLEKHDLFNLQIIDYINKSKEFKILGLNKKSD